MFFTEGIVDPNGSGALCQNLIAVERIVGLCTIWRRMENIELVRGSISPNGTFREGTEGCIKGNDRVCLCVRVLEREREGGE